MINAPKTKRQESFSKIFSLKKRYEHGEKVGFDSMLKTYDETAKYVETILKQKPVVEKVVDKVPSIF